MSGVAAAVNHEVDSLSGLQLDSARSHGLSSIGGDGFSQQSAVSCEHPQADTIALL